MLGKIEGRRRVRQRMRRLDGITKAVDMNLGKLQEMVRTSAPGVLQTTGSQRAGHDWTPEQQQQTLIQRGTHNPCGWTSASKEHQIFHSKRGHCSQRLVLLVQRFSNLSESQNHLDACYSGKAGPAPRVAAPGGLEVGPKIRHH